MANSYTTSNYCTPIRTYRTVYLPLPAPKCTDSPYNVKTITEFNNILIYNKLPNNIDSEFLFSCIQNSQSSNNNTQLETDISGINTKVNDYTNQKGLLDTYNEMNNSSLYYYKNDLTYVISKISFFIILLITYIYFFKLTGIIEPIKNLFNTVVTKGSDFINKESEKIKIPKPTIPKATNAIPKATNVIPKATNAIQKLVNTKPAIPKSANSILKKANSK